jgi:DNA-binding HxlR family transcriptional regulator
MERSSALPAREDTDPMATIAYNVYSAQCPTRQALDRIADKWTALIVGLLDQRPYRFGELRRGIEGISHKMLSHTLQSLERDGLVRRTVLPTNPPSVEYALTPLGDTLVQPLAAIRDWAEAHIEAVLAARGANAGETEASAARRRSRLAVCR